MKKYLKPAPFFPFLIGAILMAEVLYLATGCQPEETEEAEKSLTQDNNKNYMGDVACVSCHQQEYDDWKGSHHDQAMQPATEKTVLGTFDNQPMTNQGVTTRFYKEEGKFFVNTQGPDGQNHDYQIKYTFGVYPLQQYLVEFPNGRLQCLRTSWNSADNEWFDLYPDMEIANTEWLHWSRGGQNWNTMCADCHSTNLRKNYDDSTNTFHTTWSIIDVNCEACHGPGREHVAFMQAGGENSKDPYKAEEHLFLTTGQTNEEQVDQCARCHARRVQFTEYYDHNGKFQDHYSPEILRDDLYFSDGQIEDEDYVYSSFVSSKMYHEDVKCTNCHNPHSLDLIAVGNNLCAQCHEPEQYDVPEHHFHPMNTESAECVNCHMTGQTYMNNDFRRDHSFRVPRPDQSVKFGTPNACTGCHTDQTDQWAADKVVEWYGPERAPHFSDALTLGSTRTPEAVPGLLALSADTAQPDIARATAVWYLNQFPEEKAGQAVLDALQDEDPLVRYTAIDAMYEWPLELRSQHLPRLLNDEYRSVRVAALGALVDAPRQDWTPELRKAYDRVLPEYKTMMAVRSDFPAGQMTIAQFNDKIGQLDKAVSAYQEAIELDDRFNPARINLAHLYNRQGRNQEAIDLLKMVIKQEPEYGPAYYSMGLLLAEEQQLERAAAFLEKAAKLTGTNPRMFYNWGLALQNLGQGGKAEGAYIEGLKVDPNSPDLHYAISTLYLQQQDFQKAEGHVKKLLELYPGNPQFQQMMDMIKNRPQ